MSRKTLPLTDRLQQYILDVSLREPDVLQQLRTETASHPEGRMQISPEQGQFMAFLVRLLKARKALEIGVFTGYSSLAVALAMPPDGQLIACDISEEFTATARRYWQKAGVEHRIDLRIAPALDTLDDLLKNGHADTFDVGFIDADKEQYHLYFERTLRLLRPGGLIMIDNVLRGGGAADPQTTSTATLAIRKLNAALHRDERIHLSMVPIGDGLTLAMKCA